MGGQACVFYGAAEFSRDLDLLILADAENLALLRRALEDLGAEPRTTIEVEGEAIDLLAIEDLVRAKKTQLDKDWPMIRRLVEQAYYAGQGEESAAKVQFLLSELRTPELLLKVVAEHPNAANAVAGRRAAIQAALQGDLSSVAAAVEQEERAERDRDREYWAPLKPELESLRRTRRKNLPDTNLS